MSESEHTSRRAEEIREQTGCAWEIACQRAERERDEAPDDRVGEYDVSDVHLHTPDAPITFDASGLAYAPEDPRQTGKFAAIALPLLAAAPERPLWALVVVVLVIALMPVVGYLTTRHLRPEGEAPCSPEEAPVEDGPLATWTRLWEEAHPQRPELHRVYGTSEPMPCRVVDIRSAR